MKYNRLGKYEKETACIGVITLLLVGGAFLGVWEQKEERLYFLERPAWGQGEKEHTLLAEDNAGERQEIKVTVREKAYSSEEITEYMEKAATYVKKEFLGKNESQDKIREDIIPIGQVPGLPVEVFWDMGEEGYFDKQGRLIKEKIPKEGANTRIMAVFLCQEERRDVEIPLKILPPVWTNRELWRQSVEKAVFEKEEEQIGEEKIELPFLENANQVAYYQKDLEGTKGREWLIFSLSAGTLLYAGLKKEEKERKERQRRQLLAEYPVLIEKLLLYLGAGASIRNVFFKLQEEGKSKLWGRELERACQEIRNGEPEGAAYVKFGERIGLLPYIRLGVLLSQNLRSGTREILEFLEREAEESFYKRKEQAKQSGEEIGVKLLLPMGMLLLLTLGIIMVPAFLQF